MLADLRRQARRHIRLGDVAAAAGLLAGEHAPEDEAEILLLNGLLAIRRGDRAAARSLLDRAVACDPEHAEARITLARLELQAGDPDGALRHLDMSRVERGLVPTAQKLRARALIAKGDARGAAGLLSDIFRANPADSGAGRQAVALLAEAGDADAASTMAAEFLDAHPGDAEMRAKRVAFLVALADAESLLSAGPALAARDADAGLAIARRLADLGRPAEAAAVFAAIPDDARNGEPLQSFGNALAVQLLATAAAAEGADDHEALLHALDAAHALQPDAPGVARARARAFNAQFSRGAEALRAGRAGDAKPFFQRALAFNSSHDGALESLARSAAAIGDQPTAAKALERLAELKPADATIRRRLARTSEAAGDLVAALRAERTLSALGMPGAQPRLGRLAAKLASTARSAIAEGDLDRAFAIATTLLDAAPDHPATADLAARLAGRFVRAAGAARRVRQHAEASAAAERALALAPGNAAALALLAASRLGVRDFPAAVALYRRIVAAEPADGAAWAGLAMAEMRAGNGPAARDAAEAARRIAPGNATSRAILGPPVPGPAAPPAAKARKPAKRSSGGRRRIRAT